MPNFALVSLCIGLAGFAMMFVMLTLAVTAELTASTRKHEKAEPARNRGQVIGSV